ncbi:addiction module protein [Tautonia plasticadhaerens]|uniref:Addiction module component n=1 Tax=Tautonia plasticadhaerens TaxID=2527974 RepID=A0A518HBY5_9BACT|nr:addiction module protein [Tautonia plasticadhaerens]QDV38374.1 Putative addiction module component [Tautonia plasticadhaerens]
MPNVTLSPELHRLLSDALALSEQDRAILAESLLASLAPIDPRIDRLIAEEAESRIAAHDSGELDSIPAEEVFREVREELRHP